MTVSLSFSTDSTGVPVIALPQDASTITPGSNSSEIDVYIRHDGTNEITDLKLYLLPYSAGVYAGTNTAQDDYDKLISWADASYSTDPTLGGGVYINMDRDGSFPASGYQSFRTGVGDTLANAVTLDSKAVSVAAGNGEIPPGQYAQVRFRIDVPSSGQFGLPASATSVGTVYFDLLATYTSTS